MATKKKSVVESETPESAPAPEAVPETVIPLRKLAPEAVSASTSQIRVRKRARQTQIRH
jgi:hypothetical protein